MGDAYNCPNRSSENHWILRDDRTLYWYDYVSCILIVGAIVGNSFVIIIHNNLGGARVGGTTANRLIIGLAVADLLTACFTLPVPELVNVPQTAAGEIYCRIIEPQSLTWICFVASIYTLTTISIERYTAIVHPLAYRIWVHHNYAIYAFLLIWLSAISINLFSIIYHTVDECGVCVSSYPTISSKKVNGFFLFCLEYLGPLCVMLYTNIRSIVTLRSSAKFGEAEDDARSTEKQSRLLQAIHRRFTSMFTVIFVTFMVLWTPDQVAFLLHNIGLLPDDFTDSLAYSLLVKIAFLNSCTVNPIIYSFWLPRFRQEIKRLLLCRSSPKNGRATSQ